MEEHANICFMIVWVIVMRFSKIMLRITRIFQRWCHSFDEKYKEHRKFTWRKLKQYFMWLWDFHLALGFLFSLSVETLYDFHLALLSDKRKEQFFLEREKINHGHLVKFHKVGNVINHTIMAAQGIYNGAKNSSSFSFDYFPRVCIRQNPFNFNKMNFLYWSGILLNYI